MRFRALTAMALSAACLLGANMTKAQDRTYIPTRENLEARQKFEESRFGIFIHWGIYSMMGDGEWIMQNRNINYQEYARLAGGFNPSKFDAKEWAGIIKSSGAKYLTITSRHHDGFAMFDSQASDYNIVDATPFGRDVLKELSEALGEEGISLHFYYSHLDWGRTDYWPWGNTGQGTGRPEGKDGDWQRYLDFMDAQLTELLTNYGPVGAIWFDGIWDKDSRPREDQPQIWGLRHQYDLIHELQPSCLVGNNHHMVPFEGEDIQIFERDLPGENEHGLSGQDISHLPLETCQTMNWSWGYRITDKDYKSADYLIQYLVKTAGKGANLLLNIGPRPDGTLPEEAVERLEAIGKWLEANGESIYGTKGGCVEEQPWGVTTQKGNTLYVHVLDSNHEVVLPLSAHNVVEAKSFADGTGIQFSNTPDGVKLHIPKIKEDTVDYIIEVKLEKLSNEEEKLLTFLYRHMPLPDLIGYDFDYWLDNVRKTIETRKNAAWEIPEREFMHFVLPLRVNNEALDDFRTLYSDELRERVKGMDAEQAALEINHWCHEMATYTPSDGRTLPPTGTIKAGTGRCGEESVLAVAALRAAGIPARQVYTPRWAHTDDNHAWVEVYVNGNWHFMGACEPEPVLDMAWFNAPVSRAMLLHTLAFGDYDGPEDVIRRTRSFTEINVIKSYIPTRRTTVKVVDEEKNSVENATVEFKIYNYTEFYTVARTLSDAEGKAALDTGIGDMLVWACKDDRFGVAKADGEMTEIVLDRKIGDSFGLDFIITPPVENPIPSKATKVQIRQNAERLAAEDSIRAARVKGNAGTISNFRKAHKGKKAEALLESLSAKDMVDVKAEVLEDAFKHCGKKFSTYRDCPRISLEPLLPYFEEIGKGLEAKSALEIFNWTSANIKVDDSLNPQGIRIPPVHIWRSRLSDSRSRDIFFVAACRSKGIEARIDEVTGKTQYRKDKKWVDVKWDAESPTTAEYGKVKATYEPVSWLNNPLYYRHFTLSRIENGHAGLQTFDENEELGWKEILSQPYTTECGYYLLVSGIRMADGSVSAHLEFFNVNKDTETHIPLVLHHDKDKIAVIGNIDADPFLPVTGRGYFAIAIINDNSEPSIHALRQLAATTDLFNSWGRKLIVIGKDAGEGAKYLDGIKNITYSSDPDGKVLQMVYEGCKPETRSLPVIILADSFGRVVYYSQGYNTSLAEQLRACITAL